MNLKEQILKDLNEMDGSAVDNKYNNIYGKYKIAVAELQKRWTHCWRNGFLLQKYARTGSCFFKNS